MWSVEYLEAAVEERNALPGDRRARLARMTDTIRQFGVANLPRDWSKSLGDGLWELRITVRDGIARGLCDGDGAQSDHCAHFRQKDAEDAASRT